MWRTKLEIPVGHAFDSVRYRHLDRAFLRPQFRNFTRRERHLTSREIALLTKASNAAA